MRSLAHLPYHLFLLKKDSKYFTSRPNIKRYYEERIKSRPSYRACFPCPTARSGPRRPSCLQSAEFCSQMSQETIYWESTRLSILLRRPKVWSWSTLGAATLSSASFVPFLYLYESLYMILQSATDMQRLNIPIIWTSVFEFDVDPRTGTTKASCVKERLE